MPIRFPYHPTQCNRPSVFMAGCLLNFQTRAGLSSPSRLVESFCGLPHRGGMCEASPKSRSCSSTKVRLCLRIARTFGARIRTSTRCGSAISTRRGPAVTGIRLFCGLWLGTALLLMGDPERVYVARLLRETSMPLCQRRDAPLRLLAGGAVQSWPARYTGRLHLPGPVGISKARWLWR